MSMEGVPTMPPTDEELHAAILADPDAKTMADEGRHAECAARLGTILPPEVVNTLLTEAGVLRVLGPIEGDAALTAIEQAMSNQAFPESTRSVLTRVIRRLRTDEGIDIGHPATRAFLDQLQVAGVLTPAWVTGLKVAAERPTTIDHKQITRVWREREGWEA